MRRVVRDELQERRNKVYDPMTRRWVHLFAGPQTTTVNFDVNNVVQMVAADDAFFRNARDTVTTLGIDLDAESSEMPDQDAWEMEQAFFLHLRDSYPCPTPPYDDLWLEMSYPAKALLLKSSGRPSHDDDDDDDPADVVHVPVGLHLRTIRDPDLVAGYDTGNDIGTPVVAISMHFFVIVPQLGVPISQHCCVIRLDSEGELTGFDPMTIPSIEAFEAGRGQPKVDDYHDDGHFALTVVRIALMTLSLCNARNVRQQVKRPVGKLSRKAKLGTLPKVELREIRIDGTRTPSREMVDRPEGEARLPRAHSRRAHWRHYGPKYGTGLLFGKYAGRVFVPASRAGYEALGSIDHAYAVVPWPKRSP